MNFGQKFAVRFDRGFDESTWRKEESSSGLRGKNDSSLVKSKKETSAAAEGLVRLVRRVVEGRGSSRRFGRVCRIG